MSCILRISGESLDVDAMITGCGLVPDRIWRKNEAKTLKGRVHTDSGANVFVSEADFDDFACQVKDAVEFLERQAAHVARATALPEVQQAVLDFGVSLKEGYVAQYCHLPARLEQLAASAGLALEISHYACSENSEERH